MKKDALKRASRRAPGKCSHINFLSLRKAAKVGARILLNCEAIRTILEPLPFSLEVWDSETTMCQRASGNSLRMSASSNHTLPQQTRRIAVPPFSCDAAPIRVRFLSLHDLERTYRGSSICLHCNDRSSLLTSAAPTSCLVE
jgi:hypothetical protein